VLKFERLLMPMRRFWLPLVFATRDSNLNHQVLALAASYGILQKPEQILAMGKFDRITFDAQIMGGRACTRGMRLPVSVIIGQIAHGATKEEVLADYPDLEPGDIQQALEYAAWLVQEEVVMG
jgi:uncharacterized protein (DUF433 family)